jgi:hypothetical protein
VAKCLVKDPEARPTAMDLLMHPFIATAKGRVCLVVWARVGGELTVDGGWERTQARR